MVSALKKSGFRLSLLLCSIMIMAPGHARTVDMYINFDGVDGESTGFEHERWIDVESVQWAVSRTSGERVGAAVFDDLSWTQVMDKSFPKLFEMTASGRRIATVDIDFVSLIGDREQVFFQMNFRNAVMTGIGLDGSTASYPTVAGSFAYEEVKVTYTEFDSDGRKRGDVQAEWNLITNGGSAGAVAGLFGLASVGPAVVPIPAAVWLFGSGFLGLMAIARRKHLT